MKRKLLALLCALALLVSVLPAASALEGEAARAADTLLTLGLIDSTESLSAPATRAQAAELLVKLSGAGQSTATGSSPFRDVSASSAAAYAARQGWINGVTAREFRPDQAISANAWSTFLLRMLGYSEKNGDFTVSGAAVFAQHIGLFSSAWSGTMTRGALYQTALEALSFTRPDDSGTVAEYLVSKGILSRSAANAVGLLPTALTARQAADRLMSAVFCLQGYTSEKEIASDNPSTDASGFFISSEGLAITNYHSIDGSIYATAKLVTGETYPIERVIYYDADIDIAVLRVSKTALNGQTTSAFACLETAASDDVRAGDTVYTLGNPLGLGLAVSSGIVSATDRVVSSYALPCIMNTADISKGSSGGALLNVYGQVVAVTTGAYTYGNNMYLAVPIDPALSADLTVEGLTLAEVAVAQKGA